MFLLVSLANETIGISIKEVIFIDQFWASVDLSRYFNVALIIDARLCMEGWKKGGM